MAWLAIGGNSIQYEAPGTVSLGSRLLIICRWRQKNNLQFGKAVTQIQPHMDKPVSAKPTTSGWKAQASKQKNPSVLVTKKNTASFCPGIPSDDIQNTDMTILVASVRSLGHTECNKRAQALKPRNIFTLIKATKLLESWAGKPHKRRWKRIMP